MDEKQTYPVIVTHEGIASHQSFRYIMSYHTSQLKSDTTSELKLGGYCSSKFGKFKSWGHKLVLFSILLNVYVSSNTNGYGQACSHKNSLYNASVYIQWNLS